MMTETLAYRYAIYFAPLPGTPWWQAGSAWLGRCAATQVMLPQPVIAGVSGAELLALTAAPRRYGWHATLKAPFALKNGANVQSLRDALQSLAQEMAGFDMPPLQAVCLDDFLALVPQGDCNALQAVAQACVTKLHPLAAPLSPAELQRRRKADLSPGQVALLVRWGYPYVMEHFRFHCSLTGSLQGVKAQQVHALQDAAQAWFGSLPRCRFDSLALFAEPTPGADMVLMEHMRLRP
ncbi:MAG: putative phosphonate metabolism protein [Polaromonas sp.]|jgi:putative phosphonate metabolism protein|nr:putative phosphonate metabolism protein [Polaromonas sp.]